MLWELILYLPILVLMVFVIARWWTLRETRNELEESFERYLKEQDSGDYPDKAA